MTAAVEFEIEQLERLSALGHTYADIAFVYNCSVRTVERRLRDPAEGEEATEEHKAWARGKSRLCMSLRSQQVKIAMGNSKSAATMLIHMSKHQLGESDAAILRAKQGGGGLTFVIEE